MDQHQDTTWQHQLIELFLLVCQRFEGPIALEAQRLSNNNTPAFSDEELMTLYLFGTLKGKTTVRALYQYGLDHLHDWFPALPSYGGFVQRLNRLGLCFFQLANELLETIDLSLKPQERALLHEQGFPGEAPVRLVDSMPIMLAQAGRSDTARVARDWADKGYCASKGLYYHGLKLHVIAQARPGRLPQPEHLQLSSASAHDLTVLHGLLPQVQGGWLLGDKIYGDAVVAADVSARQGLSLLTPVRRKRGQAYLFLTEQVHSTWVSQVRQPIESFFNWLLSKTGIQQASRVRSTAGLMVHVFGKLAAALYLLTTNP